MLPVIGLAAAVALADDRPLPSHSAWPGGLAVLNLGTDTKQPEVRLNGKRALVLQRKGHWVALVGIPLRTKPGKALLQINGRLTHFRLTDRKYGESRIVITDRAYTEPPDEELQQRIESERGLIRRARAIWRQEVPELVFSLPAVGQASTPYGFRRYINDQLRSSHRGLDIAASEGTPIVAPAPGLVTLAADLFYTGLTVILDHGMGVQTLYAHLSALDVAEGDRVGTGDSLGAMGATGRVTGPHLHWGLTLNGTAIDPALLLNKDALAAIGLKQPAAATSSGEH